MTEKDYDLIASALSKSLGNWNAELNERHELPVEAIKQTCEIVASTLSADNPGFDRERFLAACGAPDDPHPDDRNAREHASDAAYYQAHKDGPDEWEEVPAPPRAYAQPENCEHVVKSQSGNIDPVYEQLLESDFAHLDPFSDVLQRRIDA
jgi:hypothetical protein